VNKGRGVGAVDAAHTRTRLESEGSPVGSPDVDQKPLFTNGPLRYVWQPRPEPYDQAKGMVL
jgi:hypothetical protein|tara:strand:- start:352 stop:537 length:186 start_codon:yes stop_codon:yes gene_type:complete